MLPPREQTPRESYRPGDRIVALLKDIDREARGPQIILSRTDVGLLQRLEQGVRRFRGQLDDGAVLRGQGAANTFLKFDLAGNGDNCIEAITYERGTWAAIQSGHTKDSTTLTVADANEFVVPTFAEVQQTNDPDILASRWRHVRTRWGRRRRRDP